MGYGNWRKSKRSNSQGACVEVGSYRKSTFGSESGCVEVGVGSRVGVRDTQDPARTVTLEFPAGAWGEFLAALR